MNSKILMNYYRVISDRITIIESEDKSTYEADYKKYLEVELSVYRRIREELAFQILSPDEKQAKRISWLASSRKMGADTKSIERVIQIYDTIRDTMAYIKAISNSAYMKPIEQLCIKELEIIDSTNVYNKIIHTTSEEIELAFKDYFEKVAPFKDELFIECYNKTERLYDILKG